MKFDFIFSVRDEPRDNKNKNTEVIPTIFGVVQTVLNLGDFLLYDVISKHSCWSQIYFRTVALRYHYQT